MFDFSKSYSSSLFFVSYTSKLLFCLDSILSSQSSRIAITLKLILSKSERSSNLLSSLDSFNIRICSITLP